MSSALKGLAVLAREAQQPQSLEELLQRIADCAARLVGSPRASVRLLDTRRERLVAVCRAGEPLHSDPNISFQVGEGLMGWIVAHGRPLRAADAENDARFAPRPGMREPMASFLGVPIVSGNVCFGVISAINPVPSFFTREHEELLVLLSAICAPYLEIQRLSRLATVDPLTGALNRRGADAAFPEIEATPGEPVHPLSVVMLDLDHFKDVNDRYGHAMGDQVLRQVSGLLAATVRAGDAVVRYGGEEFLLILPNVELPTAARIAERARATIEAARFVIGEEMVHVTASFGVAQRLTGEDRGAVIGRADDAMYGAKRAGRNRVACAQ